MCWGVGGVGSVGRGVRKYVEMWRSVGEGGKVC